jgi:hypothetical protein
VPTISVAQPLAERAWLALRIGSERLHELVPTRDYRDDSDRPLETVYRRYTVRGEGENWINDLKERAALPTGLVATASWPTSLACCMRPPIGCKTRCDAG